MLTVNPPKRTNVPKRALASKRNLLKSMPVPKIYNPVPSDYKGQAMVTLSYDDGFNNNYIYALPLHEKYKIPATFNVIAQLVTSAGSWATYFNPHRVVECDRRGIEIASHTYYHNGIWLTDKDDATIHFEMAESKRVLGELVPRVETVAIPYSQYDNRVRDIARQYYKGVRVHGNLQNNIPPNDRYWLNCAIAVENTTTFNTIKTRIDAAITGKTWCVIMLHGIDPANDGLYEITPDLLEQILSYIASFSRDTLLPINTRDALKYSLGAAY